MESQIEKINTVECRVKVTMPWSEVQPRLEKKMREVGRRARLPGFRPGKVPPKVVEKMFGRSVRDELARDLVDETFENAVTSHEKRPLTQPLVESSSLEKGEVFQYSARFEVPPEIEPKDYTGVKVRRRPAVVKDEQVQGMLEQKQKELTEISPIAEDDKREETRDGDIWTVDVKGKIGDEDLERKDLQIEIGADSGFIPGLMEEFRTFKLSEIGSTKSVEFVPPEERLKEEYKGKSVKLDVELREVREKVVPELDDEFARDTGDAESLDGLRQKYRDDLLEEDQTNAEREARQRLVESLLEVNEFEVAPSMIERETDAQVELFRRQLAQQGMSFAQIGASPQQMKERMRPESAFKVKAFLLLDAIGKKESIDVSDEDLEKEVQEIAEAQGKNVAKLRATMEKNNELLLLRAQMREEKILDFLMEKAEIEEAPDPEPETEQESSESAE